MEVKTKKRMFKQGLYDRLVNLSKDNPKEYWELFNKMKDCQNGENLVNQGCPIKDAEWIEHYTM